MKRFHANIRRKRAICYCDNVTKQFASILQSMLNIVAERNKDKNKLQHKTTGTAGRKRTS